MAERFWEVGFFRGLAIVSIVYFHFVWNIDYLGLREMIIPLIALIIPMMLATVKALFGMLSL
ncbi:MAG TPA: heparan-alpha-glucosaminide N-acetyltransferase domain-containing protein [Methanomassiliicoccales archaeon]|nr:heparan-alpha-glucosaminide N-acetyltransferase domain-containing protein [Methanomassiliicoccales archaeon]